MLNITTSEHLEQQALFEWRDLMLTRHPELACMFAIPNGGLRNKAVAARLWQEGVQAGVPDILLAVARREHHGLFIEMKVAGGQVRRAQKDWIARLAEQGYCVRVCWSAYQAMECIKWYLDIKE